MTINFNQLVNFRKHLHSIPELSDNEKITSRSIREFLSNCNPTELLSGVGGYGIIATWDSGHSGKEIIFRSELDALPIEELNTFQYRSQYRNVSHKCGHDGHSAILCGVAQYLKIHSPLKGKIRLLFQSSEEIGMGAKAILEDKKFSDIKPDFIFALHNLPGYKLNEIIVKDDLFTASVNSLIIDLYGKESHAAEPEQGNNPALAVSEILRECISKNNNKPERDDMMIVTPVYAELGEKAYGISPGKATVHFTLRSWNDDILRSFEDQIEKISKSIADKHGLKIELKYLQTFYASNNNTEAVDIVRIAGSNSGFTVTEKKYPFKWGEDFGLFTSRFKGCMFGLGAGENIPALHNPDYDFPDELIETGVKIFTNIINQLTIYV
ncbi:MAG TPA: amidohydrolase [Ignavibacteria bacterium]|nr:amidohydrolase [Ignavibacteria bacterium]HMR39326.1 amidohydrolase [Ignavibacteria bacterium]